MRGDGNGWVRCGQGHTHWGRHGAAGLMLVRGGADQTEVLLQKRAASSESGTWGIPGGARDSHEHPVQAALREAAEEAGIAPDDVEVVGTWHDDHGGWAYVTVVATATADIDMQANAESAELRWVPPADVPNLRLHPGFAYAWAQIGPTP